jgi:hypothetical protein
VRLVAGVDDRALERGLQPDLGLEEVGALRELEAGDPRVLPDADAAGAGTDLPGHEERREVTDDVVRTGVSRAHEVVLVGAVRVAPLPSVLFL